MRVGFLQEARTGSRNLRFRTCKVNGLHCTFSNWSGREDLNFSTPTSGSSRNPCKSLNSNACLLYLCRSVVALGHIWTQNLREHIAEHRCCPTIVLADHVRVAGLTPHSQRHPRVIMSEPSLSRLHRDVFRIHFRGVEVPNTLEPSLLDAEFTKQRVQAFLHHFGFPPRASCS